MRRGFTLVEIMISVAMALVLITGIVAVFNVSANTISTGQATSGIMRSQRSAFSTLRTDFEGYVSDSTTGIAPSTEAPFLIIHAEKWLAFADLADQQADADTLPGTDDLDGDGAYTSAGEDVTAAGNQYHYNRRNHRLDVLGFFSKGLFRRQTGQTPPTTPVPPNPNETFVTDQSSVSAYIWLGHLQMPGNDGSYYYPTDSAVANDLNRHAHQWSLGRVVLPIAPKDPMTLRILDKTGTSQVFVEHEPARIMSPFSWDSFVGVQVDGEVRGNLIMSFRDSSGSERAFYDLADAPSTYRTSVANWITAVDPIDWWRKVLYADIANPPVGRFGASNSVPKPANSGHTSMTVPHFLPNCTQFIVEFAGDFCAQDAAGVPTAGTGPDGTVDFVIDSSGPEPVRSIRFYGLQRDLNVDGTPEVVPVSVFHPTQPNLAIFERVVSADVYSCVWGTDAFDTLPIAIKPTLIRVTVQIVDKNGKLPDGLTQEFIFRVR